MHYSFSCFPPTHLAIMPASNSSGEKKNLPGFNQVYTDLSKLGGYRISGKVVTGKSGSTK